MEKLAALREKIERTGSSDLESLKLRKPTMSVNIATTKAAEVMTVAVLSAVVLTSAVKAAIVVFPSTSSFTNSSLYRKTTCNP